MTPLRLLAIAALASLASCAPVADGWRSGWQAAEANDRIMLIRETPPSFGYQRMQNQIRIYPDMGVFVAKRGIPDFLAEMTNKDRHYLIFYYLREDQAYACRIGRHRTRDIEFAGPYPITAREHRTLMNFRHQAREANLQ